MVNGKQTVDQLAKKLSNFVFPKVGDNIDKENRIQTAAGLLRDCLRPNILRNINDFTNHAKRYLNMYHPKAGYEIDRTFRYKGSGKVESRLLATKKWSLGDEIRCLCGIITELTESEEAFLANRDFSIIFSSKRGCMCLFCGPARFMNHDCQPNCQVYMLIILVYTNER
jgi:hypothetical protein